MGMAQKRRIPWSEKTAQAMDRLDLPQSLAADLPRIELSGNRGFYMDRHKGVLSYSTASIDVNGGSVVVRLWGKGLQIVAMTDDELRIDGLIEKVELVE